MGGFSFEDENTSPVPPATLYNALAKDPDSIIPKALDTFKGVENIEGNGGPGTIKKIKFVDDGEEKFVLHKIEAIDEANLGYTYSIVGGAPLPNGVEKITFDTKIVAGADGGSIIKINGKFETKEGFVPNEEELKAGKAKSEVVFKALEAYLLANP